MTTGTTAVGMVALLTDLPRPTVDRIARQLKQHRPPLWSRSGQGGGKSAAHVEPPHLTNLIIASALANLASQAPQVVQDVRSWAGVGLIAPPSGSIDPSTRVPPAQVAGNGSLAETSSPIDLSCVSLGEAFDTVIDWLARPAGDQLRVWPNHEKGISVTFHTGRSDYADLVFHGNARQVLWQYRADRSHSYSVGSWRGKRIKLPTSETRPFGGLDRTVVVSHDVIKELVLIWEDSLTADSQTKSSTPAAKHGRPPHGSKGAGALAGAPAPHHDQDSQPSHRRVDTPKIRLGKPSLKRGRADKSGRSTLA